MEYRGFKTNYPHCQLYLYAQENVSIQLLNQYQPTEDDIKLSKDRIIEKISQKPTWYRWTKRNKPSYVMEIVEKDEK